jgi:hypothetical protein
VEVCSIGDWFEVAAPQLIRDFDEARKCVTLVHDVQAPHETLTYWKTLGRTVLELPMTGKWVTVNECSDPSKFGIYRRSARTATDKFQGPSLELRPHNWCIVPIAVHELFHFIDFELLAPERGASLKGRIEFTKLQTLIIKSLPYRVLMQRTTHLELDDAKLQSNEWVSPEVRRRSSELVALHLYLSDMSEWLARTYTLFIFESTPSGHQHLDLANRYHRGLEEQIGSPITLTSEDGGKAKGIFVRMLRLLRWPCKC